MHEARWRGWSGIVVVIVALASAGCQPSSDRRDTTTAMRPDTVPKREARSVLPRASIAAEAESLYSYGPERPQTTIKDPEFPGPYVADDSLPRMSIATATLKEGARRPAQRVIARIRSERAYPKAGIDKGYNYVVRSSWDAKEAKSWVTKIVSGSGRLDPYTLTRDKRLREYTHGNAREPRLVRVMVHSVGFGACFDDPICPTGHCGYY